jgi:hypothetical protein
VFHGNGAPYPGVAVGVWTDVWQGKVTVSEPNGKYSLPLTGLPTGTFHVAVVQFETCNQLANGDRTAVDCTRKSPDYDVTVTDNCQGAGANQVTVLDFTGP